MDEERAMKAHAPNGKSLWTGNDKGGQRDEHVREEREDYRLLNWKRIDVFIERGLNEE